MSDDEEPAEEADDEPEEVEQTDQAQEAASEPEVAEPEEPETAETDGETLDDDLQPMGIADKLYLNTYSFDDESHIDIRDRQVCVECENKECTTFCPADVYEWNEEEQKVDIGYENCIECTAARYGCPYNNIDWIYPKGGHGIEYKYG